MPVRYRPHPGSILPLHKQKAMADWTKCIVGTACRMALRNESSACGFFRLHGMLNRPIMPDAHHLICRVHGPAMPRRHSPPRRRRQEPRDLANHGKPVRTVLSWRHGHISAQHSSSWTPTSSCGPTSPNSAPHGGMSLCAGTIVAHAAPSPERWRHSRQSERGLHGRLRGHLECRSEADSSSRASRATNSATRPAFPTPRSVVVNIPRVLFEVISSIRTSAQAAVGPEAIGPTSRRGRARHHRDLPG